LVVTTIVALGDERLQSDVALTASLYPAPQHA
jgi:hypothetical protein